MTINRAIISLTVFFLTQNTLLSDQTSPHMVKTSPHWNKEMPIERSIYVAKNHIYIIQADKKHMLGTYYFGIYNKSGSENRASFPIALPREISDFSPAMGIEKEELSVNDQGTIHLTKNFSTGFKLLAINFKIKISDNAQQLSIKLRSDLESLAFATPINSGINLRSGDLQEGLPPMLSSKEYRGFMGTDLRSDQLVRVNLSDLAHNQNFELAMALSWISALSFLVLIKLQRVTYDRNRNNKSIHDERK